MVSSTAGNHPLAGSLSSGDSRERVVVLGGGAAGLVAAWRAAGVGHSVILVEGCSRLGTKLRISGGGKCNLTHAGSVPELLKAFPRPQARFLKASFHAFSNQDLVRLLAREGVEVYTRENGRIFPLDRPGSAALVVGALERLVRDAGVEVCLGRKVVGLEGSFPYLQALCLEDGTRLGGDRFILATGGASYPETGTRGEGMGWLRALGVPVRSWFPALAPIPLEHPRPAWEGVALRGGILRLLAAHEGRRLGAAQGDLLFTRAGLTGPAVLELSQSVEAARREGGAWLVYASLPEAGSVEAELLDLQRSNPHLGARAWLQRHLPERIVVDLMQERGLAQEQRLKDLPRPARRLLVDFVTALPLGAPMAVPLARGEVAAGGVSLSAVDPSTMAVKGWVNLRVCGELLDIDGPVGGYNLQAAFSTGYLAGG